MQAPSDKHFVHASIFLLSNKLQLVGDKITQDITTKQWFVLLMVDGMEEKQPSITQIAKRLGSTRQNIKQLLNPLERNGYVFLSTLQDDRRSQGVTLTSKGQRYLQEINRKGEAFIQRLYRGIGHGELHITVGVIQQLFANLADIQEEMGV